jgi:nucleoside triphosphate pyrophosphatase
VTPVVLASKSVSRQAILKAAGVPFEAVGSGVDEDAAKAALLARGQGPRQVAIHLAEAKALAVSKTRPGALVIGADQTLDLDGELFDKAESLGEAHARLRRLRGRSHYLHSAVTVARDGVSAWTTLESPRLTMRAFSDDWLDGYLSRGGEALLGSVGCYLLEDEGVQLFERIEGDYFAILGLPLLPLLACLRAAGALSA